MRLLTLNTHSYIEDHQMEKLDTLIEAIITHDYDVIALQEVNQRLDARALTNSSIKQDNFCHVLVEKLQARGADYSYYWAKAHIGYDIYEEGVALLTKHPVITSETWPLTQSTDPLNWKTRVAVKLSIDYKGEVIDVVSTHHGFWNDDSEPSKHQFDRLFKYINNRITTFILGDFNTDACVNDAGYDYLITHGLHDTYRLAKVKDSGITVPGAIDGWKHIDHHQRIDYIFVNKPLDVLHSRVIFNGDNFPVVSDHFGVDVFIDFT